MQELVINNRERYTGTSILLRVAELFCDIQQHPLFELAVACFPCHVGRANGEIGNNKLSSNNCHQIYISWRWRYRLRWHILIAVYIDWLCCWCLTYTLLFSHITLKEKGGSGCCAWGGYYITNGSYSISSSHHIPQYPNKGWISLVAPR